MSNPEQEIAAALDGLRRDVRALQRGSQAAYRSVELTDGPVSYYDEEGVERLQIGAVGDEGEFVIAEVNSNPPPQPTAPGAVGVVAGVTVSWDGTFVEAGRPMDLRLVEIHASFVPGFEPNDTTQVSAFTSASGGVFNFPATFADGDVHIRLVAVNNEGLESVPSDEVIARAEPVVPETDGLPPSVAPVISVYGGFSSLFIMWDAISNPDPVTYQIYIGSSAGVAIDPANLSGESSANTWTVSRLPDGSAFTPGSRYYAVVVPVDGDGVGPASNEASDVTVVPADPADLAQLEADLAAAQASLAEAAADVAALETAMADLTGNVVPGLDSRLDDAEAEVLARARVLFSPSPPLFTADDRVIWYDTSDGFHPRYWDGSTWIDYPAGAGAIATNAIVAAKIAAGAVTTEKIQADAVVASKITAGTITSREVAARSISTAKLMIGSVDNMLSDPAFNITTLGNVEGAAWEGLSWGSTMSVQAGKGKNGSNALQMVNNSQQRSIYNRPMDLPVQAGEYFYVRAIAKGEGTDLFANSVSVGLRYRSATNVISYASLSSPAITGAGTWAEIGGRIGPTPADIVSASFFLQGQASLTTGNLLVDSVSMTRAMSGELIVDGAIIAAKIAADAVTAVKIAAGAVTAAKIEADAVTAIKIAAGAVTAGKIAADAVTATAIAANAVETKHLAADAITVKHTITGALYQTNAAAARGLKINDAGMKGYDAAGVETLSYDAVTGALSLKGLITAVLFRTAATGERIQMSASNAGRIDFFTGDGRGEEIAPGGFEVDSLTFTNTGGTGPFAVDLVSHYMILRAPGMIGDPAPAGLSYNLAGGFVEWDGHIALVRHKGFEVSDPNNEIDPLDAPDTNYVLIKPAMIAENDIQAGVLQARDYVTSKLGSFGEVNTRPRLASYLNASSQSIPNTVYTKLVGWTDDGLTNLNPAGTAPWFGTYANGVWTIADYGHYRVTAKITVSASTGGRRVTRLVHNTTARQYAEGTGGTGVTNATINMDIDFTLPLMPGDTISLETYQSTGAAITLLSGNAGRHNTLQIVKVG